MKKLACLIFTLSVHGHLSANNDQMVTNQDFIRKEIAKVSESADFSFDEVRSMFRNSPQYIATCYQDFDRMSVSQIKFFSDKVDPKVSYSTQINVENVDNYAFDLAISIKPENFSKKSVGKLDQNIDGLLDCSVSARGCGGLYTKVSKNMSLQIVHKDEPRIVDSSLDINWVYHMINKSKMYAEMDMVVTVPGYAFLLGYEKGTDSYTSHFLCELNLESETIDL